MMMKFLQGLGERACTNNSFPCAIYPSVMYTFQSGAVFSLVNSVNRLVAQCQLIRAKQLHINTLSFIVGLMLQLSIDLVSPKVFVVELCMQIVWSEITALEHPPADCVRASSDPFWAERWVARVHGNLPNILCKFIVSSMDTGVPPGSWSSTQSSRADKLSSVTFLCNVHVRAVRNEFPLHNDGTDLLVHS
jgi:hypothetical protein